jgi:excisionase family DNA binding protein
MAMRTLRDWDAYLKRQEDAVRQTAKKRPQVPPLEPERTVVPMAPKEGSIIAVPVEAKTEPGERGKPPVPEFDDYVPAVGEPRPIPKSEPPADQEPQPGRKESEVKTAGTKPLRAADSKPKLPHKEAPRAKGSKAPAVRSKPRQAQIAPVLDLPEPVRQLLAEETEEMAQKYYTSPFKETRDELLARLLDPPVTLEEVARILCVCPTTVRRYTNRGALRHFRTAGNQRRFRLSEVIAFMEARLPADQKSQSR